MRSIRIVTGVLMASAFVLGMGLAGAASAGDQQWSRTVPTKYQDAVRNCSHTDAGTRVRQAGRVVWVRGAKAAQHQTVERHMVEGMRHLDNYPPTIN